MVDLTQEEMTDERTQLIAMLKRYKLNYRSCDICNRQLFYFIHDDELFFSTNCDCVKYYIAPQLRDMSEIDNLLKEEHELISFFLKWGPEMTKYHNRNSRSSKSKIRMQEIIEALESGEVRASDLGKDNIIKMLKLINDYVE